MSRSKAKGTRAESAVVAWLQAHGFPHVERRALNGNRDRGDLAGIINFVGEIKDCRTIELGVWMRELAAEMANDGADYGAIIHKKRGTTDAGDWYATMPLHVLALLLQEALA